uniref:Adk_0 protein n=1 Tax=Fopius arisanus TaxID=64838 RepID=A0A0C9QP55_9HYME
MYVSATFLVAIAIFIDCSRSAALEDDVTNFSYEISKLARTRKSSTALEKLIKNLALPENWHADPKISIDEVSPRVTCTTCKAFAKSILELRRNGTTAEAIQDTIINLCIRLHLHTESVCRGSTKLNAVNLKVSSPLSDSRKPTIHKNNFFIYKVQMDSFNFFRKMLSAKKFQKSEKNP